MSRSGPGGQGDGVLGDANRYRDALAVPEFRAIFLAHLVSMVGAVLAHLALTVLVYVRTGSPLLAALTFSLTLFPHLVAGTLLSAVVDRVPIRRLLVGCNVLSAALAVLMALPATPVPALLGLALGLGMIRPVFLGARAATLPEVLPGPAYVPGRSLMRVVAQVSQVGGFAVSGLLLTIVSPHTLLLANAAAFVASALLLRYGTRERQLGPGQRKQPSLWRDSLSGLAEVMAVPPLRRVLLLGWAVPALAVTPEALAVPYATELSAGTLGAGLLLTALPLGSVAGELLTNWLVPARQQTRLIAATAAVAFVPLLLFLARPGLLLALVILFVSGLGWSFHLGLDRSLLEVAPAELRSRALSIQVAGVMFWQGVGYGVAGAVAELLPPRLVIPLAAVGGLLAIQLYLVGQRGARVSSARQGRT